MNTNETAYYIYTYLEDLLYSLRYENFNELFVHEKLKTEEQIIDYICEEFEFNEFDTYFSEDEMKDLRIELGYMVVANERMDAITSNMMDAMCEYYRDRR